MERCLLNKDIFFNILSRLPANVLVRLKTVSKGWKHLIEDPEFMNLQTKEAEPISLSGYFFQGRYWYCDIDVEMLSYIPIGLDYSRICQNVLCFLPEKVTLLDSSNGLICCRSCTPCSDPSIYICNPVSKEWMIVPWDRILKGDYVAFSFDPASTSALNVTTGYKLVRMFEVNEFNPGKEVFYFTFEVYDWERKVWVKSKEICHCEDSLCINKHVFIKSVLYWLTDGQYVVMFDVEQELSLLISLPVPVIEGQRNPEVCLGECKGELCCVVVSKEALMVWVLLDSFSSKWDLRTFIFFDNMEEENGDCLLNLAARVSESYGKKAPWMQPLAFKDGILFLRVSNSAFSFDVQSEKMCFLCEVSDLGHGLHDAPTAIPYSVTFASVAN